MGKTIYNYTMMDATSFEKYRKKCERNGEPCNYHQVNADCYGVMIRSRVGDESEVVEMREKE